MKMFFESIRSNSALVLVIVTSLFISYTAASRLAEVYQETINNQIFVPDESDNNEDGDIEETGVTPTDNFDISTFPSDTVPQGVSFDATPVEDDDDDIDDDPEDDSEDDEIEDDE